MTFNEGAHVDTGRVSVSGGAGGGRGGRYVLGGGAGGLIVLVLALLLGGDPGSLLGGLSGSTGVPVDTGASAVSSSLAERCRSGVDANRDVDCRVVYTSGSLDEVWGPQLPAQTGVDYVAPKVRLFSGAVNTGCGNATSDVGPFYCPADSTAYFDTSFFQLLTDRFGANDGALAQEYVVAHEFGHHIQNQLGDIGRAQQDPRGATSQAVRTELQADCYAGVWAHYASTQPGPDGSAPLLAPLTTTDVRDALSAASAVGDDRIQRSAGARVNPEGWTHGSSDQRQQWFLAGLDTGKIAACDTYAARDLNNPPALR
ncbi:neutral zinc metallopeptidase [Rhodococcus sp. (in: high G+C Gram-positive bacteria)]|uniref:KPN_02809 family neutral zinc metallopeptidase n=1 Tax=Rhodococcus sp. TaxID=1831 RepID=UPI003B8A5EB0